MNAKTTSLATLALLIFAGCAGTAPSTDTTTPAASAPTPSLYSTDCVTEQEVVAAQEAWGNGIVEIGRIYAEGGDYRQAASDHINEFYGYDLSLVLFKPTLAADEQFRASFDGALSYFVGGNPSYEEDQGFALKPWTRVRWSNTGIINNGCNMAVAMGNYFFTPQEGDEVKVEYSFAYVKDREGKLRIVLHQSSLPYSRE